MKADKCLHHTVFASIALHLCTAALAFSWAGFRYCLPWCRGCHGSAFCTGSAMGRCCLAVWTHAKHGACPVYKFFCRAKQACECALNCAWSLGLGWRGRGCRLLVHRRRCRCLLLECLLSISVVSIVKHVVCGTSGNSGCCTGGNAFCKFS